MWSTYTCILSAIDTLHSKTPQFESKRLVEYIYHVDSNQKRPGLPILVLGKIDFKTKNRERETHTHTKEWKEGYFIMVKGTIHQEDITVINIHVPNSTALKYVKQN